MGIAGYLTIRYNHDTWLTIMIRGKGGGEVVCGQVWWPILGICALHLTHPSVHTVVNIHREQWAANAAAPGEQLGTPVFCLLPIPHTHTQLEPSVKWSFKVRKGWSELQGHSRASLHRMHCERRALCLMLHLKCAVSPVGIFLTNALRSHNLCGLECSGLIYLKYEPH